MGIKITDSPEAVALELIHVNGFVPLNVAEAETMVTACIGGMFNKETEREILTELMRERAKLEIEHARTTRSARRDRDHYKDNPIYGTWG